MTLSNDPSRPSNPEVGSLVDLARAHLTGAEPRRDAASLAVVRQRLSPLQRWNQRATWRVAGAALAAAAMIASLVMPSGDMPLGVEVLAGELSPAGEVGPASDPTTIRFSDGTEVVVEAAARARLTGVSALGADVRLDAGQVQFRVAKRAGASWNVLAGAYRVHVTGTAFAVAFDEALNSLEVELFSGSVRVSGPLLERGIDVAKGQRLSVNPTQGRVQVTPTDGEPAEPEEPELELPGAEASAADAGAAPTPSAKRDRAHRLPPTEPSWQSRVAGGQFGEVLKAAERRGFDRVYQTAPLEELAALADAARYARRAQIARAALLSMRRRFSGSSQAKEATFFLGRLIETSAGPPGLALGWYELYLAEDAGGVYASQALGRKLLIVHRESGAARAAPIAQEYLRRFPEGPHAPNARKLVAGR